MLDFYQIRKKPTKKMSFYFAKLNKIIKPLNIKLIHSYIYKDDLSKLYQANIWLF